jgi:hypothetical protein
MQFIRGIPESSTRPRRSTGAASSASSFRIILPLIRPALDHARRSSPSIWTWGGLPDPAGVPERAEALHDLRGPPLIRRRLGRHDWGAIFAMSALSLVPVFVVFIVFQRFLVQGISTTGMKGLTPLVPGARKALRMARHHAIARFGSGSSGQSTTTSTPRPTSSGPGRRRARRVLRRGGHLGGGVSAPVSHAPARRRPARDPPKIPDSSWW